MIEINYTESDIRRQIEFLEDVKHYSESGSAEDRESLQELVESIRKLGDQIIPEVNGIICEIDALKSPVTYSPTKLKAKIERLIPWLNRELDKIRGISSPESSDPIRISPEAVRKILDFGE